MLRPAERLIFQVETCVGAGSDHDQVLAIRRDGNERNARRRAQGPNAGDVDPLGAQCIDRLPAIRIVAHCPDHVDAGTGPRGRDRLVGALATQVPRERATQHCLAWTGKPRCRDDQVDVD